MGLGISNDYKVINKKTNKILNYNAMKNIKFISNFLDSTVFPCYFYHPLGIPFSIYYSIKSTYNGLYYYIYYKKKVENGYFDDNNE